MFTFNITGLSKEQFHELKAKQGEIMAAIDDLKKAEAAEKADLVALSGLVTQLLKAFADGVITPAQASDLLASMNGDDTTIKTNIASIQAVLTPTPNPAP